MRSSGRYHEPWCPRCFGKVGAAGWCGGCFRGRVLLALGALCAAVLVIIAVVASR